MTTLSLTQSCFTTADAASWRKYLPASRSVFGSLEYARICEQFRGATARLHVVESPTAVITHPMLLRPVSDLPFAADFDGCWDAVTADYTGPILTGQDDGICNEFASHHQETLRDQGVIAEFAHLHPWSAGVQLLGTNCTFNREIVWVDVSQPPDFLFTDHFEHACRKNIKRAQKEGVTISIRDSDGMEHFHSIYISTMARNGALDRYHFRREFFQAIQDQMPHNARFVFAEYAGRVIAATLYLFDDENVYSFLGGADASFNHVRPTNLVVWDTIQWAHATGRKRLVLGSGFRPEDGIYRFKATFSPLRQKFFTYRNIHRPHDYQLLDSRCRKFHGLGDADVDYFPSYRVAGVRG